MKKIHHYLYIIALLSMQYVAASALAANNSSYQCPLGQELQGNQCQPIRTLYSCEKGRLNPTTNQCEYKKYNQCATGWSASSDGKTCTRNRCARDFTYNSQTGRCEKNACPEGYAEITYRRKYYLDSFPDGHKVCAKYTPSEEKTHPCPVGEHFSEHKGVKSCQKDFGVDERYQLQIWCENEVTIFSRYIKNYKNNFKFNDSRAKAIPVACSHKQDMFLLQRQSNGEYSDDRSYAKMGFLDDDGFLSIPPEYGREYTWKDPNPNDNKKEFFAIDNSSKDEYYQGKGISIPSSRTVFGAYLEHIHETEGRYEVYIKRAHTNRCSTNSKSMAFAQVDSTTGIEKCYQPLLSSSDNPKSQTRYCTEHDSSATIQGNLCIGNTRSVTTRANTYNLEYSQPINNYQKLAPFSYLKSLYSSSSSQNSLISNLNRGNDTDNILALSNNAQSRALVEQAETLLKQALNSQTTLENQKNLLDLYYHRALLDYLLSQQDLAKIQRQKFFNSLTYDYAERHMTQSVERLEQAITTYWDLVDNYSPLLENLTANRISRINSSFQANNDGYKDIQLLYQLMGQLAHMKLELAKLRFNHQQDANPYTSLETTHDELMQKHQQLQAILASTDYQNLDKTHALRIMVDDFLVAINEIQQSPIWIDGRINTLGIPNNVLFITHGKRNQDSFESLNNYIKATHGPLTVAQKSFQIARTNYDNYFMTLDNIKNSLTKNEQAYRKELITLIGWHPTANCDDVSCARDSNNAQMPDNGFSGSKLAQQYIKLQASKVLFQQKQAELFNALATAELEKNRLQAMTRLNNEEQQIMLDDGNRRIVLSEKIAEHRAIYRRKKQQEQLISDSIQAPFGILSSNSLTQGVFRTLQTAANLTFQAMLTQNNADIDLAYKEGFIETQQRRLDQTSSLALLAVDQQELRIDSEIAIKKALFDIGTI